MHSEQPQGRKSSEQFRRWMRCEIVLWKKEGLIDSNVSKKLTERYSDESGERLTLSRRLVVITSILGAVLMGVGAILFFASNWQTLSPLVKLITIFIILLGTYFATLRFLIVKEGYPVLGQALLLLTCFFFGAALWLIGQVYNYRGYFPTGVLFWTLGMLPFALTGCSSAVLCLASVLGGVWMGMDLLQFDNPNAWYLLLLVPLLGVTYRTKARFCLTINLLGFSFWLGAFCAPLIDRFTMVHFNEGMLCLFVYLCLGIFLYCIGNLHLVSPSAKSMGAPFRTIGLLTILGVTYILTFRSLLEEVGYNPELFIKMPPALIATLITCWSLALASTIAGTLISKRSPEKPAHTGWELGFLILLLLTAPCYLLLPSSLIMVCLILFNILLLLEAFGLVLLGLCRKQPLYVNLGVATVTVLIFTRYFDFSLKLLSRSFFFMGTGIVLLLIGGLLERTRRHLIQRLKESRNVS